MVASPAAMRSATTSLSRTWKPDSAQTWAMPLPIWPAPTTPILRMEWGILSACSLRICGLCLGRSLTSTISIHLLRRSPPISQNSSVFNLIELGRQLRQGLIQIRHQSVIGDLEDGGFLILVDRDDDFRILHAGEMLDSAGNADRDIEVGRHHFSGLPDLPVVRRIAGIDRRARGADRGAELVRDRLYIFGEVVRSEEHTS